MPAETNEWLTVPKFAQKAGIKETTVRNYITYGIHDLDKMSKVDAHGTRLVNSDALKRWEEQ